MGALSRRPARLVLKEKHHAQMAGHVAAQAPFEACGILAGEGGRSRHVFPAENVLKSATRYRMDPQQQFDIFMKMEARGWDFLAVFHSHPAGPPVPSATDVAEAYYPETLQLIWSSGPRGWGCRAFEIDGQEVKEVPVDLVP